MTPTATDLIDRDTATQPLTPAEAFAVGAAMDTPATRGTSLDDWEVKQYRDALCFVRVGATSDDVYLVRGRSVAHFGLAHDTLESGYRLLGKLPTYTEGSSLVRRYPRR
jgi:hypothetical protein